MKATKLGQPFDLVHTMLCGLIAVLALSCAVAVSAQTGHAELDAGYVYDWSVNGAVRRDCGLLPLVANRPGGTAGPALALFTTPCWYFSELFFSLMRGVVGIWA